MQHDIQHISSLAQGNWLSIFAYMNILVPQYGKHGPCPICGGKDRFRCDNLEGRGTWICNQCGTGDGLALVAQVKQLDIVATAQAVAAILGCQTEQILPANKIQSDSVLIQAEHNLKTKLAPDKINYLIKQCQIGQSPYLLNKGFNKIDELTNYSSGLLFPSFNLGNEPEDALFLPIRNTATQYTGAQLIFADGQKRFLTGSECKGSFIDLAHYFNLLNQNSNMAQIKEMENNLLIITEGFATALSISLVINARFYAALSANNLLNAAQALRLKYPEYIIIVAGDFNIGSDK